MVRRGDDVRGRLQQAALELYGERGYERTTTAEIAARAGVTERTFFRYFPDKREVLFDGEATLRLALITAIAATPAALGPLGTLLTAFRTTEAMIEANRPFAEPRHRVIAATPALHERELAKMASLTSALTTALRERGVCEGVAVLAAHAGMAAFIQAVLASLEEPTLSLGKQLDRTFRDLRALVAET